MAAEPTSNKQPNAENNTTPPTMVTLLTALLLLNIPLVIALTTPTPVPCHPEVKVIAKPAPPKGDGVFAVEPISKGTFVCQYQGQLLTLDEELQLYPDQYPDYCLQISPERSIDGINSNHWSRLINHHFPNANLNLHTAEGTAHFTAARDIATGEELCFDYGVAYFIFRNIVPAEGTESRSLELPKESAEEAAQAAIPLTPTTPEEIKQYLLLESEDEESKKATLMRGLDFYASVVWMEDGDTVEIPVSLNEGEQRETVSYSKVTVEYLAGILGTLWKESQEKKSN